MENTNKSFFKNVWMQFQAFSCRENKRTESNILFNLVDLFIFMMFLITTTFVSISTREKNLFHYANSIKKHFIDRPVYNEYGFEMTYKDLIIVTDWWSFIETTFIESISQFGIQNNDESEAVLQNHVLLGVPRLRQIRVDNGTCLIHNAFRNQFQTCYGESIKANEDRNGFFNKTQSTRANVNNYAIWGKISTYEGAGYIETLSLIPDENEATLEKLKTLSWIDRGTRMIVIEFVTYNANVNMLCNIKLLAEFATSGSIITSSSIQPLGYSILCEGFSERFCVLLFFLITLFYTFDLLFRVKLIGFLSIFNSIWSIFDTIVILLSHFLMLYMAWHTKYLKEILDVKDQQPEEGFSLDIICYWNEFFNYGLGLCTFILWIKTFKYIQLNKTMIQFSSTIRKCAESLFGFFVMFTIVFVAYADLSVLLFGTTHNDFRDFSTAMVTMMRMVLGDLYYSEMEETNPVLGPIYFLSYILFVFFILLNVFLAIINDTFSAVKGDKIINENKGFKELKTKLLMILENTPFSSKLN